MSTTIIVDLLNGVADGTTLIGNEDGTEPFAKALLYAAQPEDFSKLLDDEAIRAVCIYRKTDKGAIGRRFSWHPSKPPEKYEFHPNANLPGLTCSYYVDHQYEIVDRLELGNEVLLLAKYVPRPQLTVITLAQHRIG